VGAILEDGACTTPDSQPDTCDIVVDYAYDTSGRLIYQSVPHAEPVSSSYLDPGSWAGLFFT
jgi:hypothetical protein